MDLPISIVKSEFEIEFKEALGFVDADIPIRKIKPDLISAAEYLVQVIGRPTYDALIANYKLKLEGDIGASEPYRNTELNLKFKTALLRYAYAIHAKATTLSHTPNGRRMRSSEDEKTPFEWMLVADDDNLKKRAYQSIDNLIDYMDENFESWRNSESFKKSHKYLVRTVKDFDSAYVIGSRLLLIKLAPAIAQAERREIVPRLGTAYYEELKQKAFDYTKSLDDETHPKPSEDEQLLIDYIKEAICYYALSWGITRLQVNLFPDGILQSIRTDRNTVRGRAVPTVPIIDQISQNFKLDAQKSLLEVEQQILKVNPPETSETTDQTTENDYGFNEDDTFVST